MSSNQWFPTDATATNDPSNEVVGLEGQGSGAQVATRQYCWADLDLRHNWDQDLQFFSDQGFDFIRFLGEGAFAEVWEVEDTNQNKMIACKVMEIRKYKGSAPLDVSLKEMLKEVEILRQISHKNCVNFEAVLNIPDQKSQFPSLFVFLFMELCDGSLERQLMKSWWMSESQAHYWFAQIGQGLQYLHNNNISHLDIKPPNILYTTVGSEMIYKLSDFGFALSFAPNEPNEVTFELGTPVYMAPEFNSFRTFFRNIFGRPVAHQTKLCDVYSLGMSLVESLVGLGILDDMVKQTIGTGNWLGFQNFLCCLIGRTFSEDVLDLLKHMLDSDPNKRVTIDDVLQHPWVLSMGSTNQLLMTV